MLQSFVFLCLSYFLLLEVAVFLFLFYFSILVLTLLCSEDVSGSGFLISDNRVITNAHVVANATFIAVRRTGEADKIPVALHAISYELDIAVLLVPDSVTWKKKLRPLRLALRVPHLRQDVLVAGFPEGYAYVLMIAFLYVLFCCGL